MTFSKEWLIKSLSLAIFLTFLQVFTDLNAIAHPTSISDVAGLNAENTSIQKPQTRTAKELHAEGLRLFYENKFEKALELWFQEFQIEPHNANTANNIGIAYRRLKNYKMAFEYHQKAIELDPKFGHAYNHMGITFYEIADYRNSINYYSK